MSRRRRTLGRRPQALIALGTTAALVAACGSSGTGSTSTTRGGDGKRGGTLRVLYQADVDSIDPGRTYYNGGYIVTEATQRALVSFKPDAPERAVPDLAASLPAVSADG